MQVSQQAIILVVELAFSRNLGVEHLLKTPEHDLWLAESYRLRLCGSDMQCDKVAALVPQLPPRRHIIG